MRIDRFGSSVTGVPNCALLSIPAYMFAEHFRMPQALCWTFAITIAAGAYGLFLWALWTGRFDTKPSGMPPGQGAV